MIKHKVTPMAAGRIMETAVHLRLPVSFFIVRHVVPHGKWNIHKIRTDKAVCIVQPQSVSMQ